MKHSIATMFIACFLAGCSTAMVAPTYVPVAFVRQMIPVTSNVCNAIAYVRTGRTGIVWAGWDDDDSLLVTYGDGILHKLSMPRAAFPTIPIEVQWNASDTLFVYLQARR